MAMNISFPGGLRVDAEFRGHVIKTDQVPKAGGDGSAPEPFSLFLASIGTCAGIFVLEFCRARGISTEGISLVQSHKVDPVDRSLAAVNIEIRVPPNFPEKYHAALVRAADQCPVKRKIIDPPEFNIQTIVT